jgi:hypothetical protein
MSLCERIGMACSLEDYLTMAFSLFIPAIKYVHHVHLFGFMLSHI